MRNTSPDRFVRSHLKTRHLILLAELGRCETLVSAADASNFTPAAASKLLSELEHCLGVPLFDRSPRGVRATAYRGVLIRRAGTALAEMNTACREVVELKAGGRGRVDIGSIQAPSVSVVRVRPSAIFLAKGLHPLMAGAADMGSNNWHGGLTKNRVRFSMRRSFDKISLSIHAPAVNVGDELVGCRRYHKRCAVSRGG